MKAIAEIHCYREQEVAWSSHFVPDSTGVHIHKFAINEWTHLIEEKPSLISPAESEKSSRFYHREDAQRYLLARIVCRLLLAKYNGLNPSGIEFLKGRFDKPYLKQAGTLKTPCFNWSHSHNLLVIAVSCLEVGADVERIKDFDIESISEATFNNTEQRFLNESENRLEDFFMLWTRKEAAVKAAGIGLNDELKWFQVLDGYNRLSDPDTDLHAVLQNTSLIADDAYAVSICSVSAQRPPLWFFALSPEQLATGV
ncbi:4'-phosphopantetheinyl transferase family protein [Niabella ginsenosidivorans]|uniref:4'-phosphopantetheinyl transferase family protein n=1 Tax=Niabella ginsenosidivorans TaxID=1176587 RepID=UPI000A033483|nr:4'-phosphopantetheinyl transferase superfamily protein [Niabella ginsenosidivorans]